MKSQTTPDVEGTPGHRDDSLALAAVAAAGDGIVTVDGTGTITSWNAGAVELTGHRAVDAVGQTLALLVPDAFVAGHIAGFRAAFSAGRLAHGGAPAHVLAKTATGTVVPLVMSLGLLEDGRDVVGAVAVLRRADVEPVIFAS